MPLWVMQQEMIVQASTRVKPALRRPVYHSCSAAIASADGVIGSAGPLLPSPDGWLMLTSARVACAAILDG